MKQRVIKVKGTGSVTEDMWAFMGETPKKKRKEKEKSLKEKDIPLAFNLPHSEISNAGGSEQIQPPVSEKFLGINKKVATIIFIFITPLAIVGAYYGFKYIKKQF